MCFCFFSFFCLVQWLLTAGGVWGCQSDERRVNWEARERWVRLLVVTTTTRGRSLGRITVSAVVYEGTQLKRVLVELVQVGLRVQVFNQIVLNRIFWIVIPYDKCNYVEFNMYFTLFWKITHTHKVVTVCLLLLRTHWNCCFWGVRRVRWV